MQFAVHPPGGDASLDQPVFWHFMAGNLVDGLGLAPMLANALAGTPVPGAWSSLRRTDTGITATLFTSVTP